MAVDLGDVHRLTCDHINANLNYVNAGTMSLVIVRPDGVTVSVSPVTPTATGRYQYDYFTAVAGRHTVRWVGTGINPGAYTDVFDVDPADPGYVLSLAAAKKHLNLEDTGDDEELREALASVTRVVEDVVGPVAVRSFTEVHEGGRTLFLHHPPVVELTSLSPVFTGGVSYLPADLDVDGETGMVRSRTGGWFAGPLRVVYRAGRPVVPANIAMAAKVIVAHVWETQRGHTANRPAFGDDTVSTPSGFLVPHRAMQMLEPDRIGPVLV